MRTSDPVPTKPRRARWAAIGVAITFALGANGVDADTSPPGASAFVGTDPCRLLDTRLGGVDLGPDDTITIVARGDVGECTGDTGLPDTATGLQLNVTPVGATEATNLRVYPGAGEPPNASNLNPVPDQPPIPNAVTVELDADGRFSIYNRFGSVDVAVDVVGHYTDHHHDDRYYTKTMVDQLLVDATPTIDAYTKSQSDSRFAPSGHGHDGRYYTKSQSNSRFYTKLEADDAFAPTGHRHDGRYYTKLQADDTFAPSAHDHLGETWNGTGDVGLSIVAEVADAGDNAHPDAALSAVNTYRSQPVEAQFGIYGEVQGSHIDPSQIPANSAAVFGRATGHDVGETLYNGFGVVGRSTVAATEDDLWQPVGSVGVVGFGESRGVYGSSNTSYGMYATSLNWYGIYGRTSRPDNNYGLYTPDNLSAQNMTMTSGQMTTVMRNSSGQTLAVGDVVEFTGVDDASGDGLSPTMTVAAADTVGDPAVAGVVAGRYDPMAASTGPDEVDDHATLDPTPDGPVAPGEHLLVVVAGPAKTTIDTASPLTPGTKVTAGAAAQAISVDEALSSTTSDVAELGKVLAPTDTPGVAWIYISP